MKSTFRTPGRAINTPRIRPEHPQKQQQQQQPNLTPKDKDPVQVYCRVRPLQSDADLSSVRVKNGMTVILTAPEQALQQQQYKGGAQREIQYIFKRVFEAEVTQRDVFQTVAQPLVENLIRGRNGLLFTYGVTGSGKTYTMTGDLRQRGIMPRCVDALFHTISDYQAKKFVFKPDRLNGFEIQSEADALLDRQAEMNQRFAGRAVGQRRKDSDPEIASQASSDVPRLPGIEEDNMYAVFVTYIEVYNNNVYDLLEEGPIQKTLQSKIVREDAQHKIFVHGVIEVEVKNVDEAIDVFQMGQKRKRMGHTVLNAESSRSHSVFNIRLVQAPTDCRGEQVVQDRRIITVSQLSLVDLAGSERSSRTKNTGMRLREAGNINNSLMTLRSCLEYLRENQQALNGLPPKKIPYRDAKITHLFRNYFDGEGQVAMIVCINPRAEDYDENTQVLKFAEITQEVQIARALPPIKPDFGGVAGLTPGRRKANQLFKLAVGNLADLGHGDAKQLEVDVGLVYSLGSDFPKYRLDSAEAAADVHELMQFLLQRIERRKILKADFENRCDNFRLHLMQMERENLSLSTELASLKAAYTQERERSHMLENKVRIHEASIDQLNNKVSNRERQVDELTRKLDEKRHMLSQKDHEQEKQKKKFSSKMAIEVDRRDRELEIKLREQRVKLHDKMRLKDEKLRLVSNIIQAKQLPNGLVRSHSTEQLNNVARPEAMAPPTDALYQTDTYARTTRPLRGVPAANNRHRRSRSAGERWLEHRAMNPVPLGTIMQPYLKNRKSVTKLTEMKDLTAHKATRYCLVAQEADTDGDVETKLYKGNVIPTCSGGAQVVFEDVECLTQKSPVASPNRKRLCNGAIGSTAGAGDDGGGITTMGVPSDFINGDGGSAPSAQDVLARCNVGFEGHSSNKRSKR